MTYLSCTTIANEYELECWDARLRCLICHDEICLICFVYTIFTRCSLLLTCWEELVVGYCFIGAWKTREKNQKERKIFDNLQSLLT